MKKPARPSDEAFFIVEVFVRALAPPLDSPRSSAPFHLFDEFSPAISLRITETARVHTLDRVHPVHATTQKYSMRKVFFFVSLFLLSVYGHSGN